MSRELSFYGFIPARLTSSRFPGKALETINGRTVIEHLIDRAKTMRDLDGVVITTSTDPEDDILEEIAKRNDVLCYRGSLKDKLERWWKAAEHFKADYIITIDGDDPFCDPDLCERAIAQIRKSTPDLLSAPKDIACGAFTYGISREALKKACEIKDTNDTEFFAVYFTDTGLFRIEEFDVGDPVFLDTSVRLTLDYPEDLEFFRRVFAEMRMTTNMVPLRDILAFLKTRPDIVAINFFRQQQYRDNQERIKNLKLKAR